MWWRAKGQSRSCLSTNGPRPCKVLKGRVVSRKIHLCLLWRFIFRMQSRRQELRRCSQSCEPHLYFLVDFGSAGPLFHILFRIKNTVVERERSGYLAMKMPIFVISARLCQMLNPNAVLFLS